MLYIGQNEWTHVNCALWSAEVFEDDDGSLKNVHMAVIRGKQLVRPCVNVTEKISPQVPDVLLVASRYFIEVFTAPAERLASNKYWCVLEADCCSDPWGKQRK